MLELPHRLHVSATSSFFESVDFMDLRILFAETKMTLKKGWKEKHHGVKPPKSPAASFFEVWTAPKKEWEPKRGKADGRGGAKTKHHAVFGATSGQLLSGGHWIWVEEEPVRRKGKGKGKGGKGGKAKGKGKRRRVQGKMRKILDDIV